MATSAGQLFGDLTVNGVITCSSLVGATNRTQMTQELSAVHAIPLESWRVWDDYKTLLGTAASDDLGISTNGYSTLGTAVPHIRGLDLINGTVTGYARTQVQLPYNYVSGGAVAVRFCTGMVTGVAATSATIDLEAYRSLRTRLVASDIVSTSAITSVNSTTFSEQSFSLTATDLVPGSWLDLRVMLSVVNTAVAANTYLAFLHSELLCTVQG